MKKISLILLGLLLLSGLASAFSVNCSQSTTNISIRCTYNHSGTYQPINPSLATISVKQGTTTICSPYYSSFYNISACQNNYTFATNSTNCPGLASNTSYSMQFAVADSCGGAFYATLLGNITTYPCYPGDSLPLGYVCSNNQIVRANITATQLIWTSIPSSLSVGSYATFQLKYQTLSLQGIQGGNCTYTIIESGQSFPMANTTNNGTYTLSVAWNYAGTYHYYASCNATNTTGAYPFILTNSSINTLYIVGPLTTYTTTTAATVPTFSNLSFINGSYSPASNWSCSNLTYLALSGNVTRAAGCVYIYAFAGPVVFFGLVLLTICVVAYIKTRMFEAPFFLALAWTGVFALFVPYQVGQILLIGGAVGVACLGLSIFNREYNT